MSEPGSPVCAPDWLALREPADAAARATELATAAAAGLGRGPVTVRDLGCGTGSMLRWLAPHLPADQRWYLHDRDPELLAVAAARAGSVPVETVLGDLTGLGAADLAGTSLVTCSALLDLLTAEEVAGVAAACVEAGCLALFTLSVAGRVVFDPADELDAVFAAAFDAHQRRPVDGRRLTGPDAGAAVAAAFAELGATVEQRSSPWRLGPADAALVEEWLRGWIGAACAQVPELRISAGGYLGRRLDELAAGRLHVLVDHLDVLATPGRPPC
ncbi:class I SAM-dependent methyltransferase [Pseudonocardia sp. CA-107938]|uniref:class I SAM-dependent methyltransferase n=1 Tax=Pseudonocardia sp. CA-107938 TaxID=3240021 RepID=UPI003D8EAB30